MSEKNDNTIANETHDTDGKVNDMSDDKNTTADVTTDSAATATQADGQTVEPQRDGETADATVSSDTNSDSDSATEDVTATSTPDDVQFSIVFDDDADDEASALDSLAIDTDSLADGDVANDEVADDDAADNAADDAADSTADNEPADDAADGATETEAAAAGTTDGTTQADTDDENETAAEANANRVNETLKLSVKAGANDDALAKAAAAGASTDPALRLSSRIDKELGRGTKIADEILLKSYPTFSLNKVTVTDRKTGRNVLDRINETFYAGHVYAMLLPEGDTAMHETLMAVMSGVVRPHDGNVMNKSANLIELEPNELRGHRLGVIPQRYAVREDLNAERNVVYAMDASGRTFLKPKPVLARELLGRVKFDVDTPNAPVGRLDAVDQRRVAIARAIACEAEVLIADEPTGGLNDDDSVAILQLLTSLTHGDPKRCVIILTESEAVANAAEKVIEL
ncbi:ATP-binding cassette domain-containing protein [Bifidobacterium leontopitheci]|uniref:ABC transporter ATP-binding protein n=1 Tax=Bifidobacterium leontopitheci TaxID=2650774 RepID=A0A6I1GT66_9BIFI|nr:ATP-binding cassette domain-containing protein [Bifidobacterium leontopitheci]KAB7789661.1 ABC transporter ATP-binding protein [Bifidobacterium leontopitheci]